MDRKHINSRLDGIDGVWKNGHYLRKGEIVEFPGAMDDVPGVDNVKEGKTYGRYMNGKIGKPPQAWMRSSKIAIKFKDSAPHGIVDWIDADKIQTIPLFKLWDRVEARYNGK